MGYELGISVLTLTLRDTIHVFSFFFWPANLVFYFHISHSSISLDNSLLSSDTPGLESVISRNISR